LAVCRENLDVETQGLHLFHQHLEALGNTGLLDVFTLDDGFVDLHAAKNVIGLDGQQFLQRVGRAIGLQCPHFHFTKALATKLCFTTERLLRDHRVRTRGACVDLVIDEVVELQDVHVAHRHGCREGFARATIEEVSFT